LQCDTLPNQLEKILTTIQTKGRYTEDFRFEPNLQDDYEKGFLEYRRELFVIFKNIGTLNPGLVKQFIQALVRHTLSNIQSLSFGDIEIALTLLYVSAEIFPEQPAKPNQPPEENIFYNLVLDVVNSSK